MPHLILEHSPNIVETVDYRHLFSQMTNALMEFGVFNLADIKCRFRPCEHVFVAGGNPQNTFVHLEVRVFSGRSLELRTSLGESLLQLMRKTFADSLNEKICVLTVEIHEMDRQTYLKFRNEQTALSGT